jgi:hypothetical protein
MLTGLEPWVAMNHGDTTTGTVHLPLRRQDRKQDQGLIRGRIA